MGGAVSLLPSCKEKGPVGAYNPENLITMRSDTLTMSESRNGVLKYKLETPLMERYELAREPYSEYRRGIYLENYKENSTEIQSTIRSDYAIYYENRDEWMVTGNVVATGEDGRTLYTEQLFYNVKTGRVYSNVESRVVQGGDMFIGEGFESDDKFEEWVFRNYTGRVAVNTEEEKGNGNGRKNGGNPENSGENGADAVAEVETWKPEVKAAVKKPEPAKPESPKTGRTGTGRPGAEQTGTKRTPPPPAPSGTQRMKRTDMQPIEKSLKEETAVQIHSMELEEVEERSVSAPPPDKAN